MHKFHIKQNIQLFTIRIIMSRDYIGENNAQITRLFSSILARVMQTISNDHIPN